MERKRAYWSRPDGYLLTQLRAHIGRALEQAGCRPGCNVLDLGSGSQPHRDLIEARGARYAPCDLGQGPHLEIVPGQRLPLPDSAFDVGVSFQVLEHVWNLDEYLGRFAHHLRPGGHLLLSTHGAWPYHPHPTDFRRWTREGLHRELESRGFQVVSMTSIMGPIAWTTQFWLLAAGVLLRRAGLFGRLMLSLASLLGNTLLWLQDRMTPAALTDHNACVYLVLCANGSASGGSGGPRELDR